MIVILMGPSGCGKTTVGRLLADRLKWRFYDADDFHPVSSVEKMSFGEPLTDEDRAPWLARLQQLIEENLPSAQSAVIACSALRRQYRERLMPADPLKMSRVLTVYLRISIDLAKARFGGRVGHYMPAALIESQFAILEEPDDALILDAFQPVERVVEAILGKLPLETISGQG
jgi:gluconokinase